MPKPTLRVAIAGTLVLGLCVLAVILSTLAGAADEASVGAPPQEDLEAHPQRRYFDRPPGVRVLELGSIASSPPAVAAELANARLTAGLGRIEASTDPFFGEVTDALIVNDGRILVLDAKLNEVHVIGADLRFSGKFGASGEGPGEFLLPLTLVTDPDSRLVYIGDRSSFIHVFDMEPTPTFLRRVRPSGTLPRSLCILQDQIVVGGEELDMDVVRFHDSAGILLRSFGRLYRSEHTTMNRRLSSLLMACDVDSGAIFLAARALGEIRRLSNDGSVEWIVEDAGFRSYPMFTIPGTNHVRTPLIEDPFDSIESLLVLPSTHLLVQIAEWIREGRGSARRDLRSYVIDSTTGASWSIGNNLPKLLAVSENQLIAELFDDNDEVYLGIYEWRGGVR